MTRKVSALVLAAMLLPASAFAEPVTSLVVIGDSLGDEGNAFLITGGAFPPSPYVQRASNGPVAAERLADLLGVPLAPAAAGGTNFAVLGATTGPVVIPGSSPPVATENFAAVTYGVPAIEGTSLLSQTAAYLLTAPIIDPVGTLFLVWGGANDFFIDPSAATANNAVMNLATTIGLLYGAGARRFLVPNLPDFSQTPSGLAQPPLQQLALRALSIGFNSGLADALDTLEILLPGIDITRFDTFALLAAIAADPAAFGFLNAQDACLSGDLVVGVTVCANPDEYVFWDSVHPTTRAHAILGDQFASAVVPEPATMALVGLGLSLGALARRRTRRTRSARNS